MEWIVSTVQTKHSIGVCMVVHLIGDYNFTTVPQNISTKADNMHYGFKYTITEFIKIVKMPSTHITQTSKSHTFCQKDFLTFTVILTFTQQRRQQSRRHHRLGPLGSA